MHSEGESSTEKENKGKYNKRQVGTAYEKMAISYLERQGVTILEHSFRCRTGEIDIVGKQKEYLIFFEVKYRSGNRSGSAEEAVNLRKQKVICRTALFYLCRHKIPFNQPIRFDVIAINENTIKWYPNAFPFQQ
ncbi:MAG: YraN family protein [Lachnospiraceae bacterium]